MSANFTVTTKGFTDPTGKAWAARGLDVDLGDALQNLQGIEAQYPGLTMVRVVCNANSDTFANIDPVVQAYTAKGIVVELEDHADSQGGDNTGWYRMLASAYKNNPFVFLETPNEPSGSAQTVANNDIDIINAIRAAGFQGPIGVQPVGGWDQSDIPLVTAAEGTSNLYVTPHIYYNGTDPNGAASYVQSEIQTSQQNGVFSDIDEFGNAIDGFTLDPEGNTVITAVIAANEAGQTGAEFWAAGNGYHPDGVDSAFLNPQGTQLTSTGKTLQPWLSQPYTPPVVGGSGGTGTGGTGGGGTGTGGTGGSTGSGGSGSPVLIKPGSGTFTDSSGNVYSVDASGNAIENGTDMNGGSGTGAMEYANGTVYGQDAGTGNWYTWSASANNWVPASSAPPPVTTGGGGGTGTGTGTGGGTGSTGGFHVSGGQILDPNGKAFKAQGVNVVDTLLPTIVNNGQLLHNFPDLNFVRIVGINGYATDSSQSLINAITALTAKGIVVDFDNFNAPNGSVAIGSELTQEVAWLTQMATTFKNNPYVWFGTDNEPEDASSGNNGAPAGSVTAEQVADYNAIRAAGDNAPVMLEGATRAALTASSYASMTNVVWDDHFYNWTSNYSTNMSTLNSNFQSVIAPEQAIKSADGAVPIVIGEFGNATDGSNVDPGGSQTVQTVLNDAPQLSGWSAFTYYWPASMGGTPGSDADNLVNENTGALTDYGQQILAAMGGSSTGTGGGGTSNPPSPVTTGTGSDSVVLHISEDAYANGDGTSDSAGDATFTVSIDGKQLGAVFTAMASHAAGQDQTFTFQGNWAAGPHTVAVDFTNDAWGGTAATDRNLYVGDVTFDGVDTKQSATLGVDGVQTFAFTKAAPPATAVPLAVPGGGSFTDAAGNVYTIDTSGNAIENGSNMNGGGGTGAMEYAHGTVFGQDAGSGTWYTWDQNTFTQAPSPPPANTATGSSPTTISMTPSQTAAITMSESNVAVVLSKGDKITFTGSANVIQGGSGTNTLTDHGANNTFVLPTASQGVDNISGKVMSNGDKFDFTAALKATNWNGAASGLSNYLHVASDGSGGTAVSISATSGGGASKIADLQGVGSVSLQTLLAHSLT